MIKRPNQHALKNKQDIILAVGRAQHDAGILKDNKLTPEAKNKVLTGIKREMVAGSSAGAPGFFTCGPVTQPHPEFANVDLNDESTFGEFHKNVLGLYETIVKVLDVNGQFMFPPIVVDPVALALAVDPPEVPKLKFPDEFLIYGVGLPLIATKLGYPMPVDLAAKLPSIIAPSIPQLNFPKLDIKVPDFIDLLKFSQFQLKLPNLLLDLAMKIPGMFSKILAFKFDDVCSAVMESQLFGAADPRSTLQIVTAKKLSQAVGESIVIAVVAMTLGSASGGIVGGLGRTFGYVPPSPEPTKQRSIRNRMVSSVQRIAGKSWSADRDRGGGGSRNLKIDHMEYTSYCFPITVGNGDGQNLNLAFQKAKLTGGGLPFLRSALMVAGAGDVFFTQESDDQKQFAELVRKKRASKGFSTSAAPSLKHGDAILTTNGSSYVSTAYFGGGGLGTFAAVQGGAPDDDNQSRKTAIKKVQAGFYNVSGSLNVGENQESSEPVMLIVDCEMIVKS